MSKNNFDASLKVVLIHEGGFVNHPRDPGGATNLGVTKATWGAWKGKKVSIDDMKKLTQKDVTPLYKKNYWDKVKGDQLPSGLDLVVFDFGVNAGPSRAVRYLQLVVGAKDDGIIGPNTLKAVDAYIKRTSVKQAVLDYSAMREKYYKSLKTFSTFGRGWLRRVEEVKNTAIKMI